MFRVIMITGTMLSNADEFILSNMLWLCASLLIIGAVFCGPALVKREMIRVTKKHPKKWLI